MMLFSFILLCCFVLHVQSQEYYPNDGVWNPDRIYYADERQQRTTAVFPNKSLNARDSEVTRQADIFRESNNEANRRVSIEPSVQTFASQEDQFPSTVNRNLASNTENNVQPRVHSSVGRAVSNFGINMLKQLYDQPGNLVFSPSSITTVLALLQQGASGATLEQLNTALQMSPTTSAEGFYEIAEDLKKRSSNNILKTANNIYVAKEFSLNPAFKNIAIRSFRSDVTSENFGRPEIAEKNINGWVASNTNNKIPQLLVPGSLDATTQLVLVSATFFKGLWSIPFRTAATRTAEFNVRQGVTKSTQFMRTRRYFRTGVDPVSSAQVIVLPFENELYSLVILLPSETSSLSEVLSSLTATQLASYHVLPPRDTELLIPKFDVKSEIDLVPVLNKMGLNKIFGQSELNGLGRAGSFSPQVSSAVHSACMLIDEEGGSASAATSFAVVALSYDSASVNFKADRPFLAVLWDKRAALPLFMMKIVDPTL